MKTAIPSAYPAEGVFECSPIHIDLSCATPGARHPLYAGWHSTYNGKSCLPAGAGSAGAEAPA